MNSEMTNADIIRNMNNEELSEFLTNMIGACRNRYCNNCVFENAEYCPEYNMLEYLNEPKGR